ncbi:MAG TPA: VOC family protein [Steroidobacteraceae bacterium]|nr:VOC family protein [Steroidobacteraceae bacterium]
MATQLTYAIKYVSDMKRAVAFYRDELGLPLKFASPEWSEFATGPTTLALHISSAEKPAGAVELGFGVVDARAFYQAKSSAGVKFTQPPRVEHGLVLASFLDSEGAECGVSSTA